MGGEIFDLLVEYITAKNRLDESLIDLRGRVTTIVSDSRALDALWMRNSPHTDEEDRTWKFELSQVRSFIVELQEMVESWNKTQIAIIKELETLIDIQRSSGAPNPLPLLETLVAGTRHRSDVELPLVQTLMDNTITEIERLKNYVIDPVARSGSASTTRWRLRK